MIDNIQFTISWADNDIQTEQLISAYTTDFNLKPQGAIFKNNGRKYMIFATIDNKELPSIFATGESVVILRIPKNGSNAMLAKNIMIMDDQRTLDMGGEYYVSVWGEDKTGKIIGNSTLIDETNDNSIVLSYYPNPAQDGKFTMNITSGTDQQLSMKIYTIYGVCIYDNSLKVNAGATFIKDVFLHDMPKGAYVIEISNKTFKYSNKLIIL